MSRLLEGKACYTCASAKRKCGRQKPHCYRCKRLRVECQYPPSKASSFIPIPDDDESMIATTSNQQQVLAPVGGITAPTLELDTTSQSKEFDPTQYLVALDVFDGIRYDILDNNPDTPAWLQSPQSRQRPAVQRTELDASAFDNLKEQTDKVRAWLTEWVEKGSNPFIHAKLYRVSFPACMQDAYSSVTSYLCKNERNKHVTFRILEERVKHLISQHPKDTSTLDSFNFLARVQALLIYQIMGLFDGDIRLRHISEQNISLLDDWAKELGDLARYPSMMNTATTSSSSSSSSVAAPTQHGSGVFEVTTNPTNSDHTWFSWILAESIHRTWILVTGVQGTYKMIQQSRSGTCSQGENLRMTVRQGLWDAVSAPAWEQLYARLDAGHVWLPEVESIFSRFTYGDVDEYSRVILGVMFGGEKVERWKYMSNFT